MNAGFLDRIAARLTEPHGAPPGAVMPRLASRFEPAPATGAIEWGGETVVDRPVDPPTPDPAVSAGPADPDRPQPPRPGDPVAEQRPDPRRAAVPPDTTMTPTSPPDGSSAAVHFADRIPPTRAVRNGAPDLRAPQPRPDLPPDSGRRPPPTTPDSRPRGTRRRAAPATPEPSTDRPMPAGPASTGPTTTEPAPAEAIAGNTLVVARGTEPAQAAGPPPVLSLAAEREPPAEPLAKPLADLDADWWTTFAAAGVPVPAPPRAPRAPSAPARLPDTAASAGHDHAPAAAPAAPTVEITIGRVEVRASVRGRADDAAPPRAEPTVSTLDEYLRRRARSR